MPSHLVMQAREKHSVQQVSKAGLGARIGAIEGKWPLFPAKADHGAPSFHHCIFFGHEHWKFLHSHDGFYKCERRLAAKASERSEKRLFRKALSCPTNPPLSRNQIRP
jgi:hypothetical protein